MSLFSDTKLSLFLFPLTERAAFPKTQLNTIIGVKKDIFGRICFITFSWQKMDRDFALAREIILGHKFSVYGIFLTWTQWFQFMKVFIDILWWFWVKYWENTTSFKMFRKNNYLSFMIFCYRKSQFNYCFWAELYYLSTDFQIVLQHISGQTKNRIPQRKLCTFSLFR